MSIKAMIEKMDDFEDKIIAERKKFKSKIASLQKENESLRKENELLNERIQKMDNELETITALYKGIAEKYRVTENM